MKNVSEAVTTNEKIKELRGFLEKSKFKETHALLNIIDTCRTIEDLEKVLVIAKSMQEDKIIPDLEYDGFELLIEKMKSTEEYQKTIYAGNDLVKVFKERIWGTSDIGQVMQFRNCVTDMLMLNFIELGEYITLNNEIDSYIQYTLSTGRKDK